MEDDNDDNTGSCGIQTAVEYEEEYVTPFSFALILFPPMLPFFWKYHVRLTPTCCSIGYSHYFNLQVDRLRIVSATVVPHINALTGWGGWGYRKNWNWSETGYISKNGPGIRLIYKEKEDSDDETVVVFNCENPAKVCRMLNHPYLDTVVH